MRRNRLRWVFPALGVVVASWGLAATPAFADTAPITVPVITAPVAGSVAGDVAVTATSTAPTVQFYLDSVAFGGPVAVVSGTAATTWPTWGLPNAGSHTWTAADCNGIGCNTTTSAGVTVTVANQDPVVTTPVNGATTGSSLTLEATAPGGGLAFLVDGVRVGFDGTAPYSFAIAGPLTDGTHSMFVQECDVTGVDCNGPTAGANFTVVTLHPAITAVSPNPFSPHHDGRNDHTSFRIHLPNAEGVVWHIQNGSGALVRGPHNSGTLAAGDHTYAWDGRNNQSQIERDGTYTIVVTTTKSSGGITLHGTATATVKVDDTPPALSGITGDGSTFFPVVDGYLDKFSPRATVNTGGRLWLQVFNSSGTKVRSIGGTHAGPGTFTRPWNGHNDSGALLPKGKYRYRFAAEDAAGNVRVSANRYVILSHKRLYNKTVTLDRNGNTGTYFTNDQACTGYSYNLSTFAHGVWLANGCDPSFDGFVAIFAQFSFTLPGAVRYNNVHVRSYGNTVNAPEPVDAIIYNYATAQLGLVGEVALQHNDTNAWSSYGTVSATHHVNASHVVKIGIAVPDTASPEDYDLGVAEIIVSYAVLG